MRAGDTVYAATAVLGKVHALDVASGALRWTRDLKSPTHSDCGGEDSPGIWASPAIANDTVYVAAPDGAVHAMDPTDLTAGRPAWPIRRGTRSCSSPPAVSPRTGRLYVGVAATAPCDPARGRLAAVDLVSGATSVRTMVDPGQVGAAIWASASVDEDAGVLYAGTGNPVGAQESEPLAQAIVALDVATLAVLDHWQDAVPLLDCDFGTSPTLVDAGAAASWRPRIRMAGCTCSTADSSGRPALEAPDCRGRPRRSDAVRRHAQGVRDHRLARVRQWNALRRRRAHPQGQPGSVVVLDPVSGALRFTHVTPGFVLGAMAAAGDVLLVTFNAADSKSSTLEVLDARSGAVLKTFTRPSATFAGVSVSRGGLVLWADFDGHLSAFAP